MSWLTAIFRRKRVNADVAEARQERAAAEERLAYAQKHVIGPLRALHNDMLEKNHVAERLDLLVQRRLKRDGP